MSISKQIIKPYYILSENANLIEAGEVKGALMTMALDDSNLKESKWAIYDLSKAGDLTDEALPEVIHFSESIKKTGVRFGVVAKGTIYNKFIEKGYSEKLFLFGSFEELKAQRDFDPSKATNEFLNTLLASIIESTKVSLNADVELLPCIKITDSMNTPKMEVGAVAGIVSNYFTGRLVMAFTKEEFYKVMCRFLDMEMEELLEEPFDEIKDGVAELLNIFIGKAKAILNSKHYNIQKVIPNVISGDNIRISPPKGGTLLYLPFKSEAANFAILLTTEIRD